VLDILVTSRRDAKAATRFFRKLLTDLEYLPRVLVTDKLASYPVAHRRLMHSVEHRRSKYLNNRAENSHQPTRAGAVALCVVGLPRLWIRVGQIARVSSSKAARTRRFRTSSVPSS
jgi:hypothetical protein